MDGVRPGTASEQFVYKCDTRVATLHNRPIRKLVRDAVSPILFHPKWRAARNNRGTNDGPLLPPTASVTDERVSVRWKIVALRQTAPLLIFFQLLLQPGRYRTDANLKVSRNEECGT